MLTRKQQTRAAELLKFAAHQYTVTANQNEYLAERSRTPGVVAMAKKISAENRLLAKEALELSRALKAP